MDTKFIISSIKVLLPLLIVCSLFYVFGHYDSDYFWHINYHGGGDYPPMISFLLSPFEGVRSQALFILNLLFAVFFPFCLINKLAGFDAATAYLWSGLPLILFVLWILPQSIIMCLMLACLAEPLFLITFVFLGGYIHQAWWPAFLLMCGYGFYRRRKKTKKWF